MINYGELYYDHYSKVLGEENIDPFNVSRSSVV